MHFHLIFFPFLILNNHFLILILITILILNQLNQHLKLILFLNLLIHFKVFNYIILKIQLLYLILQIILIKFLIINTL